MTQLARHQADDGYDEEVPGRLDALRAEVAEEQRVLAAPQAPTAPVAPSAPRADSDDEEPDEEPKVRRHPDATRVPLADTTIWVPPSGDWRSSAMAALNRGDFDTWADATLDDESYEEWVRVDPTLHEIEDMFASLESLTGQNAGKSRRSRRMSRRTARR